MLKKSTSGCILWEFSTWMSSFSACALDGIALTSWDNVLMSGVTSSATMLLKIPSIPPDSASLPSADVSSVKSTLITESVFNGLSSTLGRSVEQTLCYSIWIHVIHVQMNRGRNTAVYRLSVATGRSGMIYIQFACYKLVQCMYNYIVHVLFCFCHIAQISSYSIPY